MKTKYISVIALMIIGFTSCLKDKGNYNYIEPRSVRIYFPTTTCYLGESVTIDPTITFADETDTLDFTYTWYLHDEVISEERILHFVPDEISLKSYMLVVTDTRSGASYTYNSSVNVVSAIRVGFGILYEKDGKSCLGHITLPDTDDGEYTTYYNHYEEVNKEPLGEQPVKLIQHFYSNRVQNAELLVIQKGGQGSVEITANTMEKAMLIKDEFISGPPANLQPITISYPEYTNVLLNQDGKIYTRYIRSPEATTYHSSAFNSDPVVLPNTLDYKITQIIEAAFYFVKHMLLYDELNNKIWHLHCNYYNNTEEYREVWYDGTYPSNVLPLNDLGDMKLVYGNSYNNSNSGSCKFALIFKNSSNEYFHQTFEMPSGSMADLRGRVTLSYSDTLSRFSGEPYLTENSKYWLLRNRPYLFFTGGPNNDKLYYHDRGTGLTELYEDFNGRAIAAIHPRVNNNQMGVGLEDGEFLLFDITDATFINKQPKLIKSISGFGRIVDVIFKYQGPGWDL